MLRSFSVRSLAFVLAPLLSACSSGSPHVAPWAVSFADDDRVGDVSMAVDGAGAIALAGSFSGQLDLGGAPLQGDTDPGLFVGMLDAGGHPAWARAIAQSGAQGTTAVAFDPGGALVVAGGFSETVDLGTGPFMAATDLSDDVFVAKLDRDGSPVWAQHFAGPYTGGPDSNGHATPECLAVDGAGNIAFGGVVSGTFDFGGASPVESTGGQTSFVVALDGSGKQLFQVVFGGLENGIGALAFDGSGDLLVGGTNSGTVIVGGGTFTTSGQSNGFVAKLAPGGKPRWAFQLGGTSSVSSIAADPAGNVIVGGQFADTLVAGTLHGQSSAPSEQSGFVLQVSPDGVPVWLGTFDGAQVVAVASTDSGVVATGTYQGAPNFGSGILPDAGGLNAMFTIRLDGQGRLASTVTFGQQAFNQAEVQNNSAITGMGVAGGDVVVTGFYSGALTIGGSALQAEANGDLFAARFSL